MDSPVGAAFSRDLAILTILTIYRLAFIIYDLAI
jgi:hypothetical protein